MDECCVLCMLVSEVANKVMEQVEQFGTSQRGAFNLVSAASLYILCSQWPRASMYTTASRGFPANSSTVV